MQLILLLCASLLSCLLLVLLLPLRLEFQGKALGEPSGAWAVVAAGSVWGISVSMLRASNAALRCELHWAGRRWPLARSSKSAKPEPKAADERVEAKPERPFSLRQLEPVLEAVLRARHCARVDALEIDVSYGFQDIALTGQISGALYALAGALPPEIRLSQRPRWDGAERFELTAAGKFSLWPGIVLRELLWFILRLGRQRLRRTPQITAS